MTVTAPRDPPQLSTDMHYHQSVSWHFPAHPLAARRLARSGQHLSLSSSQTGRVAIMQEQAEIYANSQLAQALFDVLQDLLNEGSVPEHLCTGMLTQSILKALREEVPARGELKAHLDNYKYFDNVWKFWLKQEKNDKGDLVPVTFRLNATGTGSMKKAITVECEKMNVVCVDTKVALPGEAAKT